MASNTHPNVYENKLTPPVGTNFWRHATEKVFTKEFLIWRGGGGTAWPAGQATLVTDVYTYVTGADPRQPDDFQDNNGMVYIVLVHSGKTEPNEEILSENIWYRNAVTGPEAALPVLQLPETGSGELQPDQTTNKYIVSFNQTMAMFANGGNDPVSFDAKYVKDLLRPISRQNGASDVSESQVEFGVSFTDTPQDLPDLPIMALSVFQCNELSAFPMTFRFETGIGEYDDLGYIIMIATRLRYSTQRHGGSLATVEGIVVTF
ncbi:hypothetical protein ONZ45_g4690 [Pleurotus djamor]|nr:hypothetical protein ONZ45_g4690 [Pleurotus djamor]